MKHAPAKSAPALILIFLSLTLLSLTFLSFSGVAQAAAKPVPLAFSDFFVPSPTTLQPSAKLLGLSGKRVRLNGYMVKMEGPLAGAFYLTEHPTFCDEEGVGTADLPPACVRVIVRGAKGLPLGFVGRPLIVTGVLQVGPQTEADGQVSHLRLILDGPEPAAPTRLAKKAPKMTNKMTKATMTKTKETQR